MKTRSFHPCLLRTAIAAATLFITASGQSGLVNTSAYLAHAGFRVCKPKTVEQRHLFSLAPSYRLLRAGSPSENFFAYKDEAAGVAYVGGEAEYQRFQDLARQEGFAYGAYLAKDMELDPAWRWYNAYYLCLGPPVRELSPK
jgi:hypothetical protein